jgi:hypothetical protein
MTLEPILGGNGGEQIVDGLCADFAEHDFAVGFRFRGTLIKFSLSTMNIGTVTPV